jgi:hypothetical protein
MEKGVVQSDSQFEDRAITTTRTFLKLKNGHVMMPNLPTRKPGEHKATKYS